MIGQPGPVSAWNSVGGTATGYNLIQATPANRPGYTPGNVNYKRYNYNPRIDFVAASGTWLENLATTPDLLGGNAGFTFLVTDQNNSTTGSGITYKATNNYRIQVKPSYRTQSSNGVSAPVYGYYVNYADATEYPDNAASLFTVERSGSMVSYRRNSVFGTPTGFATGFAPSIGFGLSVGRNSGGGEHVDSDVGEVIMYNVTLTQTQRHRVESYLAIKYGFTRGFNEANNAQYDYQSSTGTIVRGRVANFGFDRDVAGIGRDDASGLVQKQSISVNNGESVTIGVGGIEASNAANTNSFASDNSFLVWGNDGGAQYTDYNNPVCFSQLPTGVEARILRRWKAQVTNFAQDVTVGFETSALVAYLPLSNLRLLVDNDGTDWTNATVYSGAVLDGARIEFAGVSITSAQPFFTLATVDYGATPLPVELLTFDAVPDGPRVRLSWSTATERNNDHFEVERSADAFDFKRIGTVEGMGNSVVRVDYSLLDHAPLPGTSYYRLRQVDTDGVYDLSEVRAVTRRDNGIPVLFPNPVTDELRISGYDPMRDGPITMYNASGALVPVYVSAPTDGVFNVGTLPPGLYVVRIGDHSLHFVKE